MPFLQSHPAGAERLESIRLQIAQLAPPGNSAANEIQIDPGGRQAFERGMAAYSKYDYETAHREFLQAAGAAAMSSTESTCCTLHRFATDSVSLDQVHTRATATPRCRRYPP
jgi:hypothetical protein